MRQDLITQLIDQLWNDPDLARTYRAAMRQHALTEDELAVLDRGIMDRTLAANDAARQPLPADAERLPESLDEIAPHAPEINPTTGRRQRQTSLDMLRLHADGVALDILAMQRHYAEEVRLRGRYQPREELVGQLAAHVARVCPDLTRDGQRAQVRLAANAVFVGTGQALLP